MAPTHFRKWLASAVGVGLIAGAAPAAEAEEADAVAEVTLYLNAGIALPNNPPEFVDLWSSAVSVGAAVGVRVTTHWEFLASAHYQQFPTNEAAQVDDLLLVGSGGEVSEVASIDGRQASTTTVLGEIRFHFETSSRRFDPYMTFGAGLFDVSMSDAVVTPVEESIGPQVVLGVDDLSFGATIGAGGQYWVSPKLALTLDALFTIGFTERVSMQYVPIRLGVGISL